MSRAAGSEGAARREVRRGASERRQRTRTDRETRQSKADFPWRPIAPRALHRTPRAPLVRSRCARAASPPDGVLEERAPSRRDERSKAQDGRFPHRELRGRTALGLPAPFSRACAAHRVRRASARTERAPSAARTERRAKWRNPSDRPARETRTQAANSNERVVCGLPARRARRGRRTPRAARARSQQSTRALGGARERRARNREKRAAKHRTPGARNAGPRTPRAHRAETPSTPRASRGALRAPRPLVVRPPPRRRAGGARERRARSDRQDERRGKEEKTARTPLLGCCGGGARSIA